MTAASMQLLERITRTAIEPALALLPQRMDTPAARLMLLAIGLQESRFEHRRQIGGPARGFWQFERGGGVRGCMTHRASRYWLHGLCEDRGVAFDSAAIYHAIEHDDVLAAGLARLLLFTDPKPLPGFYDGDAAWQYYLRTWRPGKPHAHTWAGFHEAAREFVFAREI